ncbi:MAG: DUF4293 domain-containing protein [Rikenellaceae bacterium]
MIQRIQTVYLLLVTLFTGLMFALPLAEFMGDGQTASLWAYGILDADSVRILPTSQMAVLMTLSTILPFMTVFLYKRRWLQIRMCLVQFVLQLGIIAFLVYYILKLNSTFAQYSMHSMSLGVADIFPVLNLILIFLAYRGVVKDEALIKSLNRIR